MKIKEVIIVEGKNDTNVLQSYLTCETIETHGTHIGEVVFKQIEQAQKTRGVIIFTDPDHPGEFIRNKINQRIAGCKNAYIEKNKAKTTKKVGVEHASKEDIIDALQHVFTYEYQEKEYLSWDEYISFGFTGLSDSSLRRSHIARKLYLGKPNAKTLFKRFNMLYMRKADIEKLMEDFHEN